MRRIKQSLLLLTFLSILLCCQTLSVIAANDPVVVSVGEITYPLSQVQPYLDNVVAEFSEMGVGWDAQDIQETLDYVTDSYVSQGVLENELIKRGLDKLSAEDEKLVDENTQDFFDQIMQMYVDKAKADYDIDDEEAKKYAEVLMGIDGITLEAAREQVLNARKEALMLQEAAGDISLSEEEIQEKYQQDFVERDREKYAEDIESFELDVIYNGEVSFYMPAGYRRVKQIILGVPGSIKNELIAQVAEITPLQQTVEDALDEINRLTEIGGNVEKAQEAYDEANEKYYELEEAYQTTLATSIDAQQEVIDEITNRYEDGEAFADLIQEYSIEKDLSGKGLLINADSYIYNDTLIAAAMSLEKPGDISEPFVTDAGVHILYYDADVAEGPADLSGKNYEYVKEQLTQEARYAVLAEKIEEWKNDYEIIVNSELLTINLPED